MWIIHNLLSMLFHQISSVLLCSYKQSSVPILVFYYSSLHIHVYTNATFFQPLLISLKLVFSTNFQIHICMLATSIIIVHAPYHFTSYWNSNDGWVITFPHEAFILPTYMNHFLNGGMINLPWFLIHMQDVTTTTFLEIHVPKCVFQFQKISHSLLTGFPWPQVQCAIKNPSSFWNFQ